MARADGRGGGHKAPGSKNTMAIPPLEANDEELRARARQFAKEHPDELLLAHAKRVLFEMTKEPGAIAATAARALADLTKPRGPAVPPPEPEPKSRLSAAEIERLEHLADAEAIQPERRDMS